LPVPADADSDGVFDSCDNCALEGNLAQADADGDGTGDACDSCPGEAFAVDHDLDTLCGIDNCPFDANLDQANGDGDFAGTICDCDDADPTTYPGAAEINDGQDNQCAGNSGFGSVDEVSGTLTFTGESTLTWNSQAGAIRYQVARSSSPSFSVGCVVSTFAAVAQANQTFNDAAPVAPGGLRYYLVRALLPNTGSWGVDSNGAERSVPCAP
jgi:hypothetical protein